MKTRRGDAFGVPAEAVTPTKQRRIRGLATRWLAERRVRAPAIRFDVASVKLADGHDPQIDDHHGRVLSRAQRLRFVARNQQPLCQWRRSSGCARGTTTS